jgi:hypothetical protein
MGFTSGDLILHGLHLWWPILHGFHLWWLTTTWELPLVTHHHRRNC